MLIYVILLQSDCFKVQGHLVPRLNQFRWKLSFRGLNISTMLIRKCLYIVTTSFLVEPSLFDNENLLFGVKKCINVLYFSNITIHLQNNSSTLTPMSCIFIEIKWRENYITKQITFRASADDFGTYHICSKPL